VYRLQLFDQVCSTRRPNVMASVDGMGRLHFVCRRERSTPTIGLFR